MGKFSKLFGFHSKKTIFLKDDEEKLFYKYNQNIHNFLGWIPGVGDIIGISRIINISAMHIVDENSENNTSYYIGSYGRGIIEIIGLGIF
jgi:hypothetical protein